MEDSYYPTDIPAVDTKSLQLNDLVLKIQKELERRIAVRVTNMFVNESRDGFILYLSPAVKPSVISFANEEAEKLFEKYKEQIELLLEG